MNDPHDAVRDVVREHYGWVLARIVRSVRDIDMAEDALQLALEAALVQWPRAGVPDSPRAWLVAAAKNRAIDELRKRTLHEAKQNEIAWLESLQAPTTDDQPIADDMLRLVFTCCHPALAIEARVALTLRTVAGLETEEIAKAFLVPNVTMAQRLVRAKKKIRVAGVPFVVPSGRELRPRLDGVLAVIYLVFNEGYTAMRGDALVRRDLCRVALGLGEELTRLLPEEPEVWGLFALMLLNDARADARTTADGDLVLLADQDRQLWDRDQIDRGVAATEHALTSGPPGPYALQAAIAAVHAEATDATRTDWQQIVALYDVLLHTAPTPVVALNRAVAIAMASGPQAGLTALADLAEPLADYYLFHAARADLLRQLGELHEARAAYEGALALCANEAERRFLQARVSALTPNGLS